jgi:hypothetical protein
MTEPLSAEDVRRIFKPVADRLARLEVAVAAAAAKLDSPIAHNERDTGGA